MSSRPWYKWFPGDWKSDTTLLSLEEKGAYRELLDALWVHGPIADSDSIRARVMSVSTRKSRVIWRRLAPFFSLNGTEFDHPKIAEQRMQALDIIEKRKAAGSQGGRAKALANAKANALANATNAHDARAGPDPDPDIKPTLSPLNSSPVARAREEPREKRGSPNGFKARRAALAQWAEANGVDAPGLVDDGRSVRPIVGSGLRLDPNGSLEGDAERIDVDGNPGRSPCDSRKR